MSRIGKLPIPVPAGVEVTIDGSDEDKAFEELQTQFRENA